MAYTERDKLILISLGMAIFFLGFLSACVITFLIDIDEEKPLSTFTQKNIETPYDFVQEGDIEVYNDKIVIRVEGASLSSYLPTGSMRPTLDKGANGIRVKPLSEKDIHIGDIVSFKKDNFLVVHRVIEKGNDEKGNFYITKGDNNQGPDEKIRFSDIEFVTIGILY